MTDASNVAVLGAAYGEVAAIARAGRFARAGGSGWSAELVLAHLIVNERLLRAVSAAVVAGLSPRYDNAPATRLEDLQALADAAAGVPVLADLFAHEAEQHLAVVSSMTSEQRGTVVPARIVDGDEVRVDGPVPWGRLLDADAAVHLPAHAAQLHALVES